MINFFQPEEMKNCPIRRIEMAYSLESYCGDEIQILHDVDTKLPQRHLFEFRKTATDEVVAKGSIELRN